MSEDNIATIQRLTKATRHQASDNFAEDVEQLRQLVDTHYRTRLPQQNRTAECRALDSALTAISNDNDHPLHDYARVALLRDRFQDAFNWQSDNLRLPEKRTSQKALLDRIIGKTAHQLGVSVPTIEKDYSTLRSEFLTELKGANLPDRVNIPYAHESTRAAHGQEALSPHQFMGTSPIFAKTLETLRAAEIAFDPEGIKRLNSNDATLTDAQKEEQIDRLYKTMQVAGLHPELEKSDLRRMSPVKRYVIGYVTNYYNNVMDQNDWRTRHGGRQVSHKITRASAAVMREHHLFSAEAAFLFKDAIEQNKYKDENWVRSALHRLPERVTAFLDRQGFLSDGLFPAGVYEARYSIITPHNPAISSHVDFRRLLENGDPELDYTLPATPTERIRHVLYHELAHVFSQQVAENNSQLQYTNNANIRRQEMISDVFAQLCMGEPKNRRDPFLRALRGLLGDSKHCTFHAVAAITKDEYTAASKIPFAAKHALAMKIAERAAFNTDEDEDIDRLKILFQEKGQSLDDIEWKIKDAQSKILELPSGSQMKLLNAALDDITFLKELKNAHQHPSYTEDILATMRMTGNVAGAVETLAYERDDLRRQLDFLENLNQTTLPLIQYSKYSLKTPRPSPNLLDTGSYHRQNINLTSEPIHALHQKLAVFEEHFDHLDKIADAFKTNLTAELPNRGVISQNSRA